MFNKQNIKLEIIRRTALYGLMSIAAIVITLFLLAVALGYRFNRGSGTLEQSALVQFKTVPSGATINIDGMTIGSTTPTKYGVTPKIHKFEMIKKGYVSWTKDLNTKSGNLYWLDYPILVPKNLEIKEIFSYQNLESSLPSPDNRYILLQKNIKDTNFELIDLRSEEPNIKNLNIPPALLNFPNKENAIFKISSWDDGGRYVLISADLKDKTYWISIDTRSVEKSQNITNLVGNNFKELKFGDTSGNILYGITDKSELKRINLDSQEKLKTISLNTESYKLFDNKWVFFVSRYTENNSGMYSLGLYRDGEESPTTIYSSSKSNDIVDIAGGRYKGTDFIAILRNSIVEIWGGNFPNYGDKLEDKMTKTDTLNALANLTEMSFSPKSDYLLLQFGSEFGFYYFEHDIKGSFSIPGQVSAVKWFNDDYIYSNNQGSLVIREFDGSNSNNIMQSLNDQAVVYSQDAKYIYAFQKNNTTYGLYRAKMIVD